MDDGFCNTKKQEHVENNVQGTEIPDESTQQIPYAACYVWTKTARDNSSKKLLKHHFKKLKLVSESMETQK